MSIETDVKDEVKAIGNELEALVHEGIQKVEDLIEGKKEEPAKAPVSEPTTAPTTETAPIVSVAASEPTEEDRTKAAKDQESAAIENTVIKDVVIPVATTAGTVETTVEKVSTEVKTKAVSIFDEFEAGYESLKAKASSLLAIDKSKAATEYAKLKDELLSDASAVRTKLVSVLSNL